ncbi:hypothetical protein LJK87_45665 [Paenibacillus sp. P25]|nr:hypothetical protein LJK87_45665 [Paenibacillus sp. P25]
MVSRGNPFDRRYETLEELVDDISETLHCPVTLEDANHRLIAYSSHDPETDEARIATIISRRVPEKVIGVLWRDGYMQKIIESDEPVRISPIAEVGLGGRVAIGIRSQQELLGFIWVVDDRQQLEDSDLHLLRQAAQAVGKKLIALQQISRRETEGYQNFFWQPADRALEGRRRHSRTGS